MTLPAPETIRLADGRTLEFGRYGDPAGLPAMFFHGFIGSHHQASLGHEAARRHGMHLIAPNRPGVGRSTPCQRRVIADCVDDVKQLADALGLGPFAVIGVSGGAPYALACLARLSRRVPVGALVSGLGRVGDAKVLARMSPVPRQALLLGRRLPWLARAILAYLGSRFRSSPEGFLDRLVGRWSEHDRELFRRPEVRASFLGDLREVLVTGGGSETLVRELQLYFDWGFDLADIPASARVLLWHGRHDLVVPPFMTRHAADRLPRAVVAFHPGGHFMIVEHLDELVRWGRDALADFVSQSARTLDDSAGAAIMQG